MTVREMEINWKRTGADIDGRRSLRKSEEVSKFAREIIGDNAYEVGLAIYLDGKNRVIGLQRFQGTDCQTNPYLKNIIAGALNCGSPAIVFVHNHPSGNTAPSDNDRTYTETLKQACNILDIKLHYSFADENTL